MRDYPSYHLGTNYSKGTACSKKGNGCKRARETIQHITQTQTKVKEQLVVKKDMNVNKHERLSSEREIVV